MSNSDVLTNAGRREVPAPSGAQANAADRIQRETKYFRDLSAVYTDSIRASDFKANIAFLFVEFMMGPILWNYASLPRYLPIPRRPHP